MQFTSKIASYRKIR